MSLEPQQSNQQLKNIFSKKPNSQPVPLDIFSSKPVNKNQYIFGQHQSSNIQKNYPQYSLAQKASKQTASGSLEAKTEEKKEALKGKSLQEQDKPKKPNREDDMSIQEDDSAFLGVPPTNQVKQEKQFQNQNQGIQKKKQKVQSTQAKPTQKQNQQTKPEPKIVNQEQDLNTQKSKQDKKDQKQNKGLKQENKSQGIIQKKSQLKQAKQSLQNPIKDVPPNQPSKSSKHSCDDLNMSDEQSIIKPPQKQPKSKQPNQAKQNDANLKDQKQNKGLKQENKSQGIIQKKSQLKQAKQSLQNPIKDLPPNQPSKSSKHSCDDLNMSDEQSIIKPPQKQPKSENQDQAKQNDNAAIKPSNTKQKSSQPPNQNQGEPRKRQSANNKSKDREVEDMEMQDEDSFLNPSGSKQNKQQQKQSSLSQSPSLDKDGQSLPACSYNSEMKQFYSQSISLPQGEYGRLVYRYVVIQRKYLNQLRVLIELNKISDEELKIHKFNRPKYRELVMKKTQIFQSSAFPKTISQKLLITPTQIAALEKLQSIEIEISNHQRDFNSRHIQGLNKFPKQMLMKTKQQLFEESLQKEVKELQSNYSELKKDYDRLAAILEQKKQLLKKQEQRKSQTQAKVKQHLAQLEKKSKRTLFPGSEQENKIIKGSEFAQEYKVTLKNKAQLDKKLLELRNDGELTNIKQELDKLMKERIREEELLLKQKEKYGKYRSEKKKLSKKVYMGDVDKMKNHPKIVKLEKELKLLMKEWKQKQEAQDQQGSRINPGSGIRLISRINY